MAFQQFERIFGKQLQLRLQLLAEYKELTNDPLAARTREVRKKRRIQDGTSTMRELRSPDRHEVHVH